MRRLLALALIATLPMACRASGSAGAAASTEQRPFAAFVAQRLVVTPLHAVNITPGLGWTDVPSRAEVRQDFDARLMTALTERGITGWAFPEALAQSHQRNPTYGANPHTLAAEPLRAGGLAAGARVPEPLSTQLRTIAALQDARFVMAPVELRVDRLTGGAGRAALRVVLIDVRLAEVRWVGDLRGDTASRFEPAIPASVAARVADLFVSP